MSRTFEPTVLSLPPVTVGLTTFEFREKQGSSKGDGRKGSFGDWVEGVCYIDTRRSLACQVRYVWKHLVSAIHHLAGLNDSCDEEVFTQNLAQGLTQIACQQPVFWSSLLRMTSPAAAATVWLSAEALPSGVFHGGKLCTLSRQEDLYFDGGRCFGLFTLQRNVASIQLAGHLKGPVLATVALHEALHYLHSQKMLGDTSGFNTFRSVQGDSLPGFIEENPQFFSWWESLLRSPEEMRTRERTKGSLTLSALRCG